MFMENILESDFQILITSNDFLFDYDDDVSFIITGLLDVIQRSSTQLKLHYEIEQDRIALLDSLKKSLILAELIIKEKKNREKITNTEDVIW